MARGSKVEHLLKSHYNDMLNLNREFIRTLNRPRFQMPTTLQTAQKSKRKLSKKQLTSLAAGRKILALNRGKQTQI